MITLAYWNTKISHSTGFKTGILVYFIIVVSPNSTKYSFIFEGVLFLCSKTEPFLSFSPSA